MSNDFKIIAIRPLEDCDSRFLKVLTEGEIYQFYNQYKFIKSDENDIHSEIIEIKKISDDYNIYSFDKNLEINVSAIVGKNGSGKSSLIELLFATVYVIGINEKILPKNQDYYKKKIKAQDEKIKTLSDSSEIQGVKLTINAYEKKIEQINEFIDKLKVELFFLLNEDVYCLVLNKIQDQNLISNYTPSVKNDKEKKIKQYNLLNKNQTNKFDLNKLFYTIALNYSTYGLNSRSIGYWIEELFHKNDGYLTPLVINPMRKDGDFSVNRETHLTQTRILANLINDDYEDKVLLEGKRVNKIRFILEEEKYSSFDGFEINNIIDNLLKKENLTIDKLEEKILIKILTFSNESEDISSIIENVKWKHYIIKYTIRKLFKIAKTYDEYKIHYQESKAPSYLPELNDFNIYLDKLSNDKSHKTLKLRQVLNTLRYDILKGINNFATVIELSLAELKLRILGKPEPIEELMPAAMFEIELSIENNAAFELLSSGEQQLVNVLQTIYYHLLNLNSVEKNKNLKQDHPKYENINIIFDEIELYFHPEMQRKFISEFIGGLTRIKLNNIKNINIIFSTHSPFILSDIPSSNILFLKVENAKSIPQKVEMNTFGANIHDLLAHGFFLENGFMGEFAKNKIEETIRFLNFNSITKRIAEIKSKLEEALTEKDRNNLKEERTNLENKKEELIQKGFNNDNEYHLKLIRTIGEPIIRTKLQGMYDKIFLTDDEKKKEALVKYANELGFDINPLKKDK
ncbi:MAG: AAA family ATPase [Bacteroidales bacterium]|nr:AAA family ATPase [Bacteroidales bacterium]